MHLKKLFSTAAVAAFVSVISLADNTKYAVCVGINKYSEEYGAPSLFGCVNDAKFFRTNLVELGGWSGDNTTLLLDSAATKDAIRAAIAAVAGKAEAGDTFIYQHSSHGGNAEEDEENYSTDVFLCAHDADYWDYELAEDLEAFPSGVKVVVIVDACHSGGLFKGARRRGAKAAAEKRPFDLAKRVTAIMDASRTRRLARGEKGAAKKLASSEIGWVTAAEYYEYSMDGGYYDTDEWLTDPDAEGNVVGGIFLGSFAWSWWSGSADTADDGDNDGWFDAYEGWAKAKAFCKNLDYFWEEEGYSFTPQLLNKDVLRSVELGESRPLPPPANDDFANATIIEGKSGSVDGTNLFATREDDEPEHNNGKETGSVWWSWMAPADGIVAFDTKGSDFDTVMAIYTNSTLDTLELVDWNDDEDSDEDARTSRCVFDAVAGTTYHVAVVGYSKRGDIALNWEQVGVDDVPFAPMGITASTNLIDGILVQWNAALAASSYTVFRADAEDGEKSKLGSTDETEWLDGTALPETEYWYWVTASNDNGASDFAGPEMGWMVVPPANDNFADAIELSGASGTVDGSNLYATREEDEPWHIDGGGSEKSTVWWSWTATADGTFAFDTDGSDFDTVIAIYTGDSLDSLEKVASNDDGGTGWRTSSCSFLAEAGTAYYIAVAGYGSQMGDIVLNWGVPLIASWSPEEDTISLLLGETQTFSLKVFDPDDSNVSITWTVYDGNDYGVPGYVGIAGSSLDFSSDNEGWYYICATVSDGNRTAEQWWDVRVAAPLAASSPDETIALPTATTGVDYYDSDGNTVYLGFSGGVPFEDENGDEYFRYEIVEGALPDSLWIDGCWDYNASRIYFNGTPSDSDAGDYAFTVRITDATGTSVEQAFTLSVALNENLAPVIDSWSPVGYTVCIEPGETQTFSVEAHDPEGEDFSITWTVYDSNDDVVSGYNRVSGPSLDFSSDDDGWYYVRATVSDGVRFTSQSWKVHVKTVEPLAAPSPDKAIALPDAMTGVDYLDSNGDTVYLGFTGGTPFVDELGYYYFDYGIIGSFPDSLWIDGYWDDDASKIYIGGIPSDDDAGDYAFTIRITDATGVSVEQAFTLSIALNENDAPVIDSWSPTESSILIEPGETQTFSVDEAHDPEGEDLYITWTVYDDDWYAVPGYNRVPGSSLDFSTNKEGWYSVYAIVSDGTRSTEQRWNLRVKGVPPNDNFANATLLEGVSGSVDGSNEHASREDGEPMHGVNSYYDYREGGSVWWRWTAPRDGLATFTADTGLQTAMAVYVGDSIDSLNRVASGFEWDGLSNYFRATEGTTYYIAVAGYYWSDDDDEYVEVGGEINLTWEVGDVQPLVVETREIKFMVLDEPGSFYRECDLEASGGIAPYTWRLADGATLPGEDGGVEEEYGELWLDSLKTFDVGTYTFDVVVTDSEGTETTETITLTIALDPNHRPVIDGMTPDVGEGGLVTIRVDETLKIAADYSDPDGDELVVKWSLRKDVYDDEYGYWYYVWIKDLVPEEDGSVLFSQPEGEYEIELSVKDGKGLYAYRYLYVNVIEADALVIDGNLPNATEGEAYSTTLTATGGTAPYAWTLADDPNGFYCNGAANLTADGEFTVDIDSFELGLDPGQVAYRDFLIRVEDSDGHSAEQIVTLAIKASPMANARPVIDRATPRNDKTLVLRVGDAQTFSVIAHDPEGEPLAYSWNWETYDNENGTWDSEPLDCSASEFTWTPKREDIGMHDLKVSCSDGDKEDSIWWTIKVVSANVITVGETIPDAAVGLPYEATLMLSGGTAPYSCALFGYDVSAEGTSFAEVGEAQGWRRDDSSWTLDLPFGFPFNGGVYSQAEIDSNGRILFRDDNDRIISYIYATYSGIYDDLRTDRDGCDIFVDAYEESVTVRWAAVTYEDEVPVEFSVTLNSDGGIVMKYGNGGAKEFGSRLKLGDNSCVYPPEEATGTDDILFVPKTEFAPGLTLSADGTISGTSTQLGTFAVPVFVFDAEGAVWSGTVTLKVAEYVFFKATFNANGGQGGKVVTVAYGAALSAPKVTREGYTLTGWQPAVPATMPASNVTYKAQWTPTTYNVAFNANGGKLPKGKKMAAQTMTYGKSAKLRKNVFTKNGYKFYGWAISANDAKKGIVAFKDGQNVSNLRKDGKTTTLYAIWAKPTYKVAFYGTVKGVSGKMTEQKVTYGKSVKLKANKFKRKGYKFVGWATTAAKAKKGKATYKNKQAVQNLDNNGKTVKLYAVWKK